LLRAIGPVAMAAMVFNVTVGAGIFVLPALVAQQLGTAAPLAYAACTLAIGLVVLCFAEAGSRTASTGGCYAYLSMAFGPFAGFLGGALVWFAGLLASAGVANVVIAALAQLMPAAGHGAPRVVLLIALFVSLAAANVRGVRTGAQVSALSSVAKLLPLALLVVVGVFYVQGDNLRWAGTPSLGTVGRTAIVLVFAYAGMEDAVTPGGEVRNPSRTLPIAVISALLAVSALYLALQVVAQGVLGSELTKYADAPLAVTAERVLGPGGRVLILLATAVSCFGHCSANMLAGPRSLFAFARDGLLPRWLGDVHPGFRTPTHAIVAHAAIAGGLAITGSFAQLAIFANVTILLAYLGVALAVIQLRRRGAVADGPPFLLPGGALIPLGTAIAMLWFLSSARGEEWMATLFALAVAAAIFLVARARGRSAPLLSQR